MSGSVIVVGIDGSEGSRRALRWALHEAALRGSTVEAITVWPPRGSADTGTPEQSAEQRKRADEMQRHVIAGVVDLLDNPPTVSREVVHGDAVDVLLQASAHAELIVVGSHGLTGMRHAALGSVSEACALLASCPSVVVPPAPPNQQTGQVAVI